MTDTLETASIRQVGQRCVLRLHGPGGEVIERTAATVEDAQELAARLQQERDGRSLPLTRSVFAWWPKWRHGSERERAHLRTIVSETAIATLERFAANLEALGPPERWVLDPKSAGLLDSADNVRQGAIGELLAGLVVREGDAERLLPDLVRAINLPTWRERSVEAALKSYLGIDKQKKPVARERPESGIERGSGLSAFAARKDAVTIPKPHAGAHRRQNEHAEGGLEAGDLAKITKRLGETAERIEREDGPLVPQVAKEKPARPAVRRLDVNETAVEPKEREESPPAGRAGTTVADRLAAALERRGLRLDETVPVAIHPDLARECDTTAKNISNCLAHMRRKAGVTRIRWPEKVASNGHAEQVMADAEQPEPVIAPPALMPCGHPESDRPEGTRSDEGTSYCRGCEREGRERLAASIAETARQLREDEPREADPAAPPRPKVVCLCGSTRFWRTFQELSLRETLAGRIVLSIGAAKEPDSVSFGHLPPDEYQRVKADLDQLHCRKIDLADEVLILDVGGYVGESTRNEIAHAECTGKRIRYLSREHPDYVEPATPRLLDPADQLAAENDRLKMQLAEAEANADRDLRELTADRDDWRRRARAAEDLVRPRPRGADPECACPARGADLLSFPERCQVLYVAHQLANDRTLYLDFGGLAWTTRCAILSEAIFIVAGLLGDAS